MKRRGHGGGPRNRARAGARAEGGGSDAWLRELAARGRDPEAWAALSEDELQLVAYQQCLYFGATRDPDTAESLGVLFRTLLARVPVEERNELLDRVTEAVASGASNVLALLPFLQHEDSSDLVSRAALSFASLMPLTGGDEMTGPRTLTSMLEHADSHAVQAGLLGGLLALGDARVLPLLAGVWARIEPEAREAVAALAPPFVYAMQVEALLAWLADPALDAAARAPLLRWLAALPACGRGRVLAVARKFPENAPDDRPEIEVVGEWSAPEFGARIADPLRALAAAAASEEPYAEVLAAWHVTV